MDLDQLRVKAAEDVSGAEQRFLQAHAAELSADERKKFEIAEPVAAAEKPKEEVKVVKASEEVKGTEGVVAIQASDLKAIQDNSATQAEALKAAQDSLTALQASITSLQAGKQADEEEKIKAEVTAHARRGAILPDAIDSWTKMILAAEADTREMLINNLKSLSDNPLLGKKFGSEKTEGSAAMDVEADIAKKIKEVMAANPKLDAYTARKQILMADPDLEIRATQAVRAATGAFDPFEAAWGTNAHGLQGVNPDVTKQAA